MIVRQGTKKETVIPKTLMCDDIVCQGAGHFLMHARQGLKEYAGRTNRFVVVCTQIYGEWYDIAETFMAMNATKHRLKGRARKRLLWGVADHSLCEHIAKRVDEFVGEWKEELSNEQILYAVNLIGALITEPSDDFLKCIILENGGCTVFGAPLQFVMEGTLVT